MNKLSKITRYNCIYTALLVLLLAVLCWFVTPATGAKAAELDDLDGAIGESGVYINSSTVTRTFISLPLSKLKYYALGKSNGVANSTNFKTQLGFDAKAFKRSQHKATLIIEFPDVKVPNGKFAGQTVLITCTAQIEIPAVFGFGNVVDILSDVDDIYVYDSWYQLFTDPKYGNNFHNFKVSIYGSTGVAAPLLPEKNTPYHKPYSFRLDEANIYQAEVPEDIDDPDSEHYNPGGGLGSITPPESLETKKGCSAKLSEIWLAMPKWAKALVIVPLVLLIIGLIFKVIKWVVK